MCSTEATWPQVLSKTFCVYYKRLHRPKSFLCPFEMYICLPRVSKASSSRWMWWLTAGIQVLRKLRLENCKFKAALPLTHREGEKGGGGGRWKGRQGDRETERREAFRKRMGLCLSACGKMEDFSITPALYNAFSTESHPPFPTPSPFNMRPPLYRLQLGSVHQPLLCCHGTLW